jgi:uncharacterized phage protein (TIGR02218 family)
VVWSSGANAGLALEIRGYDSGSRTLEVFVPPPFALAIGDGFEVYPACDKRFATCRTVWNNARNFRGEPHLPGRDFLLTGAEGGG